jgi:hypothetical protein
MCCLVLSKRLSGADLRAEIVSVSLTAVTGSDNHCHNDCFVPLSVASN